LYNNPEYHGYSIDDFPATVCKWARKNSRNTPDNVKHLECPSLPPIEELENVKGLSDVEYNKLKLMGTEKGVPGVLT
jgi:hypothetical protein